MTAPPMLTIERLVADIEAGTVDTVVVAFTDMQGRLQGKRLHAQFFLDAVLEHGTEGCNYLLAVDVDMNTVDGYAISSWERGYGDLVFDLDLAHPAAASRGSRARRWCSATCPGSTAAARSSPVAAADPARARSTRRPTLGCAAFAGTELEFIVFEDTYEQAWDRGYRGLTPANQYNVDYSMLGTRRVEPLLRDIRNDMYAAGLIVESAKGECNLGQHEIAFRYDEVVAHLRQPRRLQERRQGDRRAARQVAHLHGQVRRARGQLLPHPPVACAATDGAIVFADGATGGRRRAVRALRRRACRRRCASSPCSTRRTSTPTSGSSPGSFAPTAVALGPRQPHLRAAASSGTAPALRLENRLPGGDVNPYLARRRRCSPAGCTASSSELRARAGVRGQRLRRPTSRTCRRTLREARDLFAGSAIARAAFGDEVVDHYVNAADVELAAFDAAVTDWERIRGFERL